MGCCNGRGTSSGCAARSAAGHGFPLARPFFVPICRVFLQVVPAKMKDRTETPEHFKSEPSPLETEPRWPALVALLAVSGLYAALPASLAVVPHWYLLVGVSALLVPTIITHYRGKHEINQGFGYAVNAVVT